MIETTLCTGNRAVCYGAIDAGCRHFFGYPITPQNDIPEYMSEELPKLGGIYKQTESEVSSINMVYGAVAAGVRAMTSTSSPGFSLMQEAVSGIAAAELPAVVVDVQRGGPGLGTTQTAQMDYFQATKGGGHGAVRSYWRRIRSRKPTTCCSSPFIWPIRIGLWLLSSWMPSSARWSNRSIGSLWIWARSRKRTGRCAARD